MVRYLIRFSYMGTKYRGVQSQSEASPETVVRALQLALESLRPANVPSTSLCSRTDKGVHALMNAVHVDLDHRVPGEVIPPHVITQGMNKYFRENNHEILAIRTSVVPDTFSVRWAAKWRSYIYRLAVLKPTIVPYQKFGETKKICEQYLPVCEIGRCHVVDSSVDINKVKEALKVFHGVHDFTSFTKGLNKEPWRTPIRTVDKFELHHIPNPMFMNDPQYLNIDMWEFYIQSRAFLYYQVRKMVGAALGVGTGRLTVDDVILMLEKPGYTVQGAPRLVPPYGLFLSHIEFDKRAFTSPIETDANDDKRDS